MLKLRGVTVGPGFAEEPPNSSGSVEAWMARDGSNFCSHSWECQEMHKLGKDLSVGMQKCNKVGMSFFNNLHCKALETWEPEEAGRVQQWAARFLLACSEVEGKHWLLVPGAAWSAMVVRGRQWL